MIKLSCFFQAHTDYGIKNGASYTVRIINNSQFNNMKKVTIYTTPTCVYCKMTKAFFQEHNIAYEERNVAVDADARREMIEKSGQMGVPVVEIDGQILVGFDQSGLSRLLDIK